MTEIQKPVTDIAKKYNQAPTPEVLLQEIQ